MTTAYTDLLGLALPVQGELDGSWGDTINNAITSLLDDAVAGTTTLSTDADVTLTSTAGTDNQARASMLLWTATGTTTRTITAPAQSKTYVVINKTGGSQSIKLVGAGPTTGITVVSGEKCIAAWNGSDFVKVASSVADGVTSVAGTGTVNGLTLTGTVTSTGNLTLGGTLANVSLTSAVTGTLPVTSGGTGATTLTGLVKGNGTGAFTAAASGTDYAPATTGTSILKASSGGFANAVSGTDYAPATSGTAILKGNNAGGFANAASGTDYAPATSGTAILYGNGSGGFSNVTVGGGLTFASGTLSTDGTAGLGTVTSVAATVPSFLSVSGTPITNSGTLAFAYSGTALPVANGGTGATTITGLIKGNGTSAFSAATSGTDYAPATSGTSLLKGNNAGGFSSAVSGTDYAPATTGTSILKASSGGFTNAVSGTDYAPATTGSSLLKGDNAGGFANAVSGTDYAPPTSGTSVLYGNNAGGFSNVTIGTGLSFAGGTLSTTSTTGGTVTSVDATVPAFLSVSGGPVTTSGTLAITYSGMALPVANGGTGALTLTGLVKGNGTEAFTAVTAPTGDIVGTSDTQTLTNKTISADTNTLSGIAASSFVLSNASGNIDGSAAAKSIPTGDVVGTSDNQTLTNKTINVDNNTVSGIAVSSFVLSDANGYIDGAASAKAIPSGAVVGTSDTQTLTNKTINATTNTLGGLPETSFVYTNGSGSLDGTGSAKAIPSGAVVGTSDTQTLTNKTVEGVVLNKGFTEQVYALSGTTVAANPANGSIQTWTLTANSTVTDSLSSGQSLILKITPSTYTITWPTMTWALAGGGGEAPTLYATGSTLIVLFKIGTALYGAHMGDV